MVTLKQVAERAGVSPGAASAVLTRKNSAIKVSQATEQRIRLAARELNYHPNASARSLRTGRSFLIGMILPSLGNSINTEIVQGVEDILLKKDIGVLLSISAGMEDLQEKINFMLQKNIDGAIIVPSVSTKIIPEFQSLQERVPTVRVAGMEQKGWHHEVYTDPYAIGYLATKHLLALGHRKILYFCRSCRRIDGYRQALEESGIHPPANWIATDLAYAVEPEKAFQYYQSFNDKPTAVIFFSDLEAVFFMRRALDAGIRIPEELSIIGTDGDKLSELYHPTLTTICQQSRNQGREAARMLLAILDKRPVFTPRVLPPDLLSRESCRNLDSNKKILHRIFTQRKDGCI